VLLCDSVLQKHAQLLALVSELETNHHDVPSANKQLKSLLETIEHLRPKFEAARYFFVDKTILFTVSYSIVTLSACDNSIQMKSVKFPSGSTTIGNIFSP
jgi:hypothetical protein